MACVSHEGPVRSRELRRKSKRKEKRMIRNLKALGLALVAMLALGAVMASAASAQNGEATSDEEVPFTLTGEETGTLLQNSFTSALGNITCDGSTYTGHKYNETPHKYIPPGANTVTVTPHYATKCFTHIPVLGTRPTTVTLNGCDFVLHIGATTGEGDTYGVTADLICPPGKKVEVHVYKATSTEHLDVDSVCTITIAEQKGLSGPHLTDTTNGHVDLAGTFINVVYHHTGSLCGEKENQIASLDIDVTLDAHDEEGNTIGVGIDHS